MAEITDYFGKASIDTDYAVATTVKTARTAGASVLEAIDLSKFSDDTPVFVITYKKTTDPETGEVSVIDQRSFKALVNTGANTLTNLTIAPGYVDDIGNEEGDFIECIPTSYWVNSLIEGLFTSLNSDGTLKDDSVDTDAVEDGAIIPAKLESGTGTDWAWQDWTPTYSNLTVNNGTVVAKYIQIGKTVHFRFSLVCGSSTALGTSMEVSLPVTAASGYGTSNIRMPIGNVVGKDGAATYFGVAVTDASTTDLTIRWHADGNSGFGGTFPFSETTSDSLDISGTYEAA